jgi:hypothetical protein
MAVSQTVNVPARCRAGTCSLGAGAYNRTRADAVNWSPLICYLEMRRDPRGSDVASRSVEKREVGIRFQRFWEFRRAGKLLRSA